MSSSRPVSPLNVSLVRTAPNEDFRGRIRGFTRGPRLCSAVGRETRAEPKLNVGLTPNGAVWFHAREMTT